MGTRSDVGKMHAIGSIKEVFFLSLLERAAQRLQFLAGLSWV